MTAHPANPSPVQSDRATSGQATSDRASSGPGTADPADDAPVRVVVVDDEALMRAGLVTILSALPGIEVVGQAGDGAAGVALTRRLTPDVVLMDVQMPVLDGLAATRAITAEPGLRAAVIVLTTFHREDYLLDALRAGACGFLLKTDPPERLAEAVLAAASGDGLLSPEVTRAVIARAVASGPAAPDPSPAQPGAAGFGLTARELDVLRLVATGASNDEIAARLFVTRATVKTHMSNVLTKLGLRDRVQAVVFAYRHGLGG